MGLGWGRHERRACSRAQRRFASVPAYAGSYREPLLRRNQAQPVVHDRQHVNLCAVRECGWGGAELSRQGRVNRSSPATISEAPRLLRIVASMPSTSSNSRTPYFAKNPPSVTCDRPVTFQPFVTFAAAKSGRCGRTGKEPVPHPMDGLDVPLHEAECRLHGRNGRAKHRLLRSEEHTSELQSRLHLVCRLLLEKKKKKQ